MKLNSKHSKNTPADDYIAARFGCQYSMKCIILSTILLWSISAVAQGIHNFDDPVLQKRYNTLIKDIRCPVCQGQSIGGSDAPLAEDLRGVVAQMLLDNRSDSEVFTFMTDRYGDFAVFKPPFNYHTYILWIAPFVFIATSMVALILKRRTKTIPADYSPSSEALSTARELLKE